MEVENARDKRYSGNIFQMAGGTYHLYRICLFVSKYARLFTGPEKHREVRAVNSKGAENIFLIAKVGDSNEQ